MWLEGEACSELTLEGARQVGAGRVDEPDRFPERGRIVRRRTEIVAVVRMVGQVERLEDQLEVAAFTDLQVLGQPGIQVEVRIAAQVVVWNHLTLACVVALHRAQLVADERSEVSRLAVRHYECRG